MKYFHRRNIIKKNHLTLDSPSLQHNKNRVYFKIPFIFLVPLNKKE